MVAFIAHGVPCPGLAGNKRFNPPHPLFDAPYTAMIQQPVHFSNVGLPCGPGVISSGQGIIFLQKRQPGRLVALTDQQLLIIVIGQIPEDTRFEDVDSLLPHGRAVIPAGGLVDKVPVQGLGQLFVLHNSVNFHLLVKVIYDTALHQIMHGVERQTEGLENHGVKDEFINKLRPGRQDKCPGGGQDKPADKARQQNKALEAKLSEMSPGSNGGPCRFQGQEPEA